ncbi:MAG: hypothetical protein HYZ28_08365 [Myxococcales bacterium]|nr:hypothetical protein [Myxococcales bacterium]
MPLFERGRVRVGRVAGVAVRVHWTAPVGALVFCGFRFDPLLWFCFFGLVLLHEVGHALVVKACRAKAVAIDLTGFGGLCHWRGEVSAAGRAAIAWGGVWAQLALLAFIEAWLWISAPRLGYLGREVVAFFTYSNAWMILLNLVPIAPLDGAEAWRLPVLLGRAVRSRLPGARARPLLLTTLEQRDEAEEAVETGERGEEVKALVSSLLEAARKEPPP